MADNIPQPDDLTTACGHASGHASGHAPAGGAERSRDIGEGDTGGRHTRGREAGGREPGGWTRHRRGFLIGLAVASAFVVVSGHVVGPGTALILTHLGRPSRVVTTPGFTLGWPAPFGGAILVDTRLHATLGTLQTIPAPAAAKPAEPVSPPGQPAPAAPVAAGFDKEAAAPAGDPWSARAYAVWRVAPDADSIRLFARASAGGGVPPLQALRDMLDAALPEALRAASGGQRRGGDLPGPAGPDGNTTASAVTAANAALLHQVGLQARRSFGIEIISAGLVEFGRLAGTHAADAAHTAALASSDAAARAQADATAAEIRAEAARDSRIARADAQVQAASIEADARKEAAEIEGKAYASDPELYQMLRSLDTLSAMVGPSTRLVLRTDAAPFNVLVQGPPAEPATK